MIQVWTWRWMKRGRSHPFLFRLFPLLVGMVGMFGRLCSRTGVVGLCSKMGLHARRDLGL